ncbi:putative ATPase [Tamaricihabitans halophyticus]|uniref:Putative ATPase n=1 Tax=Tamaricihabitans halophyticus TaxID=1262583 RepID=A0A4R2R3K4_9PSEU|nr:BTAD domain-containing putative transcriptional regulator [Tamaricihabitans halophyticus]TCP56444.1 putative ATPase [Tamaricihabitans halophyticus]
MRFGVLGPLLVQAADGTEIRVPEAKVRLLLANLLAHAGQPISSERLVESLWGAHPPGNPANTLQTKISQLRRALRAADPDGGELLTYQASGYLLRVSDGALDSRHFRMLVQRANTLEDPADRAARLAEALALWRGPAFAEFAEEPFAITAVRALTEERLAAIEAHAEARLALGEPEAVLAELAELVSQHPERERARALQLRALYRAGRQREALDGYTAIREHLAERFGLEPGPELAELHQAMLRQDPALTPVRRRTELPAPLTELIGRESAVERVATEFAGSRLVTLTGPGGVGKTRLAIAVAERLADRMRDGVRLVELAGLDRQARQVTPRHGTVESTADDWLADVLATALGIRQDGHSGSPLDLVANTLRDQQLLLVLDNCEQLVSSVATVTQRLLAAAPGLRILATSRETLQITGEVRWPVPPLELPARDGAEPAVIRESSAVRLFTARATAAVPGFALDAGNAATVAAICRKLDGLPLALELAASKVRVLTVDELLDRLQDRFAVLASGPRGAPSRQRTLRAMIDWSWELLTEAERAVLRRLAIHTEGSDLAAAETLCADEDLRPGEVLGQLDRLVDRSLVIAEAKRGGTRYRLLESVAAYALDRLREADEFDTSLRRHREYYLAVAERAAPLLTGPEQRDWLRVLDAESGNLGAALESASHAGAHAVTARLVRALTWYWFLRGRHGEARRWLAEVVARAAEPSALADATVWLAGFDLLHSQRVDEGAFTAVERIADPVLRMHADWFAGYAFSTIGELRGAARHTERALDLARRLNDKWTLAAACSDKANQELGQGRLAEAEASATTSERLFAELADGWGQLQASFILGALAEIAGDYPRAARLHDAGLRLAERLRLWPEVSYQLCWLGRVALLRGEYAAARDYHERAVRVGTECGFQPGVYFARTGLALGARREGDLDTAERHLRALVDWHRRDELPGTSALAFVELGFVAEQRGDPEQAAQWQLAAYELASESPDPRALALTLEGLAGARALAGAAAEAARLLGAAASLRSAAGAPLPAAERMDVDRISAAAAGVLGAATFDAEFAAGAGQPPAELVRPHDS